MVYLTYTEYQEMGGTLDEATFNEYEFEARSLINWYTFDRLKDETELPDEVKECMYMLIRYITDKNNLLKLGSPVVEGENSITPQVVSMSNDGVSTTYAQLRLADAYKYYKAEMDDIINKCLRTAMNSLGRKLLYRGLYPGE